MTNRVKLLVCSLVNLVPGAPKFRFMVVADEDEVRLVPPFPDGAKVYSISE